LGLKQGLPTFLRIKQKNILRKKGHSKVKVTAVMKVNLSERESKQEGKD